MNFNKTQKFQLVSGCIFLLGIIAFILPIIAEEMSGTKLTMSGFAIGFGGKARATVGGVSTSIDLATLGFKGYILFGLTFVFGILGLAFAALTAFGVIKLEAKVTFFVLLGVAAVNLILYIISFVTGFDMGDGKISDLIKILGFGFWLGLVAAIGGVVAGVLGLTKAKE